MDLPRFTAPHSPLGVALAFVGSALTVTGAYALSLIRTTKIDCQWYCIAHPAEQHLSYVSPWIIALIVVGGVAPLLVLLRPRLWWAGAACSLAIVGFFGEYFLYVSLVPPFPSPPPEELAAYAWLLLAGAVITTVGMMLIRPTPPIGQLAPSQPAPSS